MARENQGLQIALIVFVMLTIILGVTTYLFFRQYEEASIKEKANLAKSNEQSTRATKAEDDVKELKRLIFGVANTDKVESITNTTFNEDMKKYGGSYSDADRFYRPLLEKMAKTIDDKNKELASAKNDNQVLEDKLKVFEANKQPQIDDFKKLADEANKDREGQRAQFKTDRDRLTQSEIKLAADRENIRKDGAAEVAKKQQEIERITAAGVKLRTINDSISEKLVGLTSQKFEVPSGEVRWVNQRTGTAWINLGRADSLQRQVTFGVYPADITDMSIGGKKASIEVTQIVGDHLAEARIFDDKLTDPVMPGDKIYTPIWTTGEKRHFALAGFLDPNGEGKNDVQAVKNIIELNGGVVDCYLDDKGRKVGDMTVNTRYLVLGETPSEKSQSAVAGITKIVDEAKRFGVQKIQLNDLLQRMGWKNRTPVVRYGRGANAKDFAAKPEGDQSRRSTGNVFEQRKPPARLPTSAQ